MGTVLAEAGSRRPGAKRVSDMELFILRFDSPPHPPPVSGLPVLFGGSPRRPPPLAFPFFLLLYDLSWRPNGDAEICR